jgi:sugar/nucleoside kinase (ribokinase family)
VLIDVNWRPVFWEGVAAPREVIAPYIARADIVKLSEEEAEWLLGIPGADALEHPCKARRRPPPRPVAEPDPRRPAGCRAAAADGGAGARAGAGAGAAAGG